jgi:hypothetical protein
MISERDDSSDILPALAYNVLNRAQRLNDLTGLNRPSVLFRAVELIEDCQQIKHDPNHRADIVSVLPSLFLTTSGSVNLNHG